MTLAPIARRDLSRSGETRISRCVVIIPTYNASRYWEKLYGALDQQGLKQEQILIIDSSSTDDTRDLVRKAGFQLQQIPTLAFRHGATRQAAAESQPWADFLIYLTQDAVPCNKYSFTRLLSSFQNREVGAAYGRQLPRLEAGPIERHARLFNYSGVSELRSFESREDLGIKAAFFSNSFAAYRRKAFDQVGGFPKNTIVSEEVTVAARMLISNWKIAYQANATVFHSHSFSMREEFSRYFDIGVHHRRERSLLQQFGGPGGEGLAFVISELKYLSKSSPLLVPVAFLRSLNKFMGYHLGLRERTIPLYLKELLSAQPLFWQDEREYYLQKTSAFQNTSGH